MGYWIPHRLLLNIRKFSNKNSIDCYHRCFAIKKHYPILNIGSKNLRTTHFCFSTSVKQIDITEYLYLKELIADEKLVLDHPQNSFVDKENNLFTRLYPSILPKDDAHFESLVQSSTIDEVFQRIQGHFDNEQYVSQAIATLWDLQKVYCSSLDLGIVDATENHKNFIQIVKSHPSFLQLLESIDKSSSQMSDDILSSTLLVLRKFQIYPWDPVVHSAMCTSIARIGNFPLTALSKWCLALSLPIHKGRLILPAALPAFHDHVDKCQSLCDYEKLSVCFTALAPIVDKVGLTSKIFIDRITHLLDTNLLNSTTPLSVLVRILKALYQVAKSNSSSSAASIRILYILQDSEELKTPSSVIYFNVIRKSWEAVSEPISLVRIMESIACRWLEELDFRVEHLDLLNHVSHSISFERKQQLERHLIRVMEMEQPMALEPYLKNIFRIIRASKISDPKLVDMYWQLVIKNLEKRHSRTGDFVPHLLDSAQWYMFFNNNLGGTYRSKFFESKVLDWIHEMRNGDWSQSVSNVRYFCRLAAFVLAYGGYPTPIGLLDKLVEIEDQLAIQDIFYLSRGIQLGRHWLRRPHRHFSQRDLGDLLLILDRRTTVLLQSKVSDTLGPTTTLLHAALYRNSESHGVKDAALVHEVVLRKCETQLSELTARLTRDLIFFLDRFRNLRLPMVDVLTDYALKHHEHLGSSILVNTLVLCFNLGYTSETLDLLAPIASQSLERKEYEIVGLFVLESALALILNNRLPLKLVNEIFTVRFLDKLDAEVAACYSKASYPARVRRTLMELNRSVCIDMPEANVPWFHEKYCQEQMYSNPPMSTSFHADVHQYLLEILESGHFIKKWSYSPYYHLIDFEIHFNENRQPINPSIQQPDHKDNCKEKIAVLALLPSSFTANHGNLTGLSLLRHRQLEILGYRVVAIPHHLWNSLALSSSQAKRNYLKHKLYRQRST